MYPATQAQGEAVDGRGGSALAGVGEAGSSPALRGIRSDPCPWPAEGRGRGLAMERGESGPGRTRYRLAASAGPPRAAAPGNQDRGLRRDAGAAWHLLYRVADAREGTGRDPGCRRRELDRDRARLHNERRDAI